MADLNLFALAERDGINALVNVLNSGITNSDGTAAIDAYRQKEAYSRMALDKIKITQDSYVFLKYAKTYTVPKGHEQWVIRKNYPLTEHTVPLLEGIPPRSDKTRKDRIVGTFHQYGRYMEFSDRVDFTMIDPIISEYAFEYGDVAVRTLHRLARKEMLNSTFVYFANQKESKGELVVGDYVGLADFRLAALKMARLAVKPIGSVYKVITSEEHYWDLMKDPLIVEYIGANNGLSHYKTGQLPDLFGISFEKTMLDDYAYGYELGNPGEYKNSSGDIYCRVYLPFNNGYEYGNVAASGKRTTYVAAEYKALASEESTSYQARFLEEGGIAPASGTDANETNNRLADGSWIPIRVRWAGFSAASVLGITTFTTKPTAAVTTETQLDSSKIYYKFAVTVSKDTAVKGKGTFTLYYKYDATHYEEIGTTVELEAGAVNEYPVLTEAVLNAVLPSVKQLPIHTAIMIGDEALARLEIEGEGNVQVFVKQKGSAGVLDPIEQRQSIGFKINSVGFKRIREEAIWLFHHVPTQATATADISLN